MLAWFLTSYFLQLLESNTEHWRRSAGDIIDPSILLVASWTASAIRNLNKNWILFRLFESVLICKRPRAGIRIDCVEQRSVSGSSLIGCAVSKGIKFISRSSSNTASGYGNRVLPNTVQWVSPYLGTPLSWQKPLILPLFLKVQVPLSYLFNAIWFSFILAKAPYLGTFFRV